MSGNYKWSSFDDSYGEETYRNSNLLATKKVIKSIPLDNAEIFYRQSPLFFWLMCLFVAISTVFGPLLAYKIDYCRKNSLDW